MPERKFYMLVNGVLNIGPDTQKQLAQCVGMTVNGSLLCPESLYATLGNVKVNGASACYPDGRHSPPSQRGHRQAVRHARKARPVLAARRLIMVDPELDAEALRAKGAAFSAAEVIVAQSKVEALLDLIDEKADIVIVPDGTAVVLDDLTAYETPAPLRQLPLRDRRRDRPQGRRRARRDRVSQRPRRRSRVPGAEGEAARGADGHHRRGEARAARMGRP